MLFQLNFKGSYLYPDCILYLANIPASIYLVQIVLQWGCSLVAVLCGCLLKLTEVPTRQRPDDDDGTAARPVGMFTRVKGKVFAVVGAARKTEVGDNVADHAWES